MSKFDTHGGYFSPDNYIRINEGGTHDENPNGGVQMGVDPEGVPNMVEEDEAIYDDYVFSDNITVDDAMVEKHNLPVWAKGKLYSKVTDRLVEEAEERPMDPISNKGLQEMLSRLRDAQEEQKQLQQERELEDELSNLSPEELDQLEAMLGGTDQDSGGVVGELGEQGLPPGTMIGPVEPVEQMPAEGMPMMRDGGYINKFAGGGLADFVKNVVNAYTNSRQGSSRRGRYAIDRSDYWGGRSARDVESAGGYDDFTEYIIAHADDPAVQEYLRALDAGINTSTGARTLFGSNDQLNKGWEDLYRSRRKDGALGIYHLTPEDLSFMTQAPPSFIPGLNLSWPYNPGNDWATFSRTSDGYFFPKYDLLTGEVTQYQPGMTSQQPQTLLTAPAGEPFALRGADPKDPLGIGERGTGRGILVDESILQSDVNGTDPKVLAERERARRQREKNSDNPVLSTIPRYSGALAAGALGLYNAAMPADEYTLPNVNPVLPQGQIHLRDPRYNPLDEEQMVNTVLAANAGTNRQMMNSGLGPSVGATLLASDYNAGRNIGLARQAVWNANNESRNAVTTAHNQNASALANFDYGQSRDRAQILNDAAYRNRQNDMMRQRLNYISEGEKYAAIQSSLDSVAQALSGIGQENAVLNAINSNRALYDWLSPNRSAAYKAATNEARDGGLLKKKKTTTEKRMEKQVEELMKDAGIPTKEERRETKRRQIQKKINDIWSPATPSEFKDLFSGRKKKKN